jgi:SAM-dependent methyltransferase
MPVATASPLDRAASESVPPPQRACPACGGRDVGLLLCQPAGRHLPIQTVFEILQCRSCRLAWVANVPPPEELAEVYDEPFFASSQQNVAADERGELTAEAARWPIYLNARRRLEQVRRLRPAGRLLDVGCGKGVFLKLASASYDVTGVDVSEAATRHAREVFGLDVRCSDFHQAALPENEFDVVTAWDVLAGFTQPQACLRRIARTLRPGGWLVMTLPDVDTLAFKLLRRAWPLLIPPINLFYFSRRSTGLLLERAGLRMESYTHPGKYLSGNFVFRKLGRALRLHSLDRESVRLPWVRNLYLNLRDIATVTSVKPGTNG